MINSILLLKEASLREGYTAARQEFSGDNIIIVILYLAIIINMCIHLLPSLLIIVAKGLIVANQKIIFTKYLFCCSMLDDFYVLLSTVIFYVL